MLKIFFSLILMFLMSLFSWWGVGAYLFMAMFVFIIMIPVNESLSMLGWNIFIDTLSFSLCFLTFWLVILMLLASNTVLLMKNHSKLFMLFVMFLFSVLLVSFLTTNYLMFYFFFEASLIPTLIIITGWGYQPERLQAGIYFMLYTLTASLPLLVVLFYVYSGSGSLTMYLSSDLYIKSLSLSDIIMGLGLLMAFFVKMPMFLVHLWLPKAHVEAPVAGSMILAGVLLKLGGYGICRVLGKFFYSFMKLSPYIIGLSLFGMIYVGFMCIRLNDMKALVAYSSVAHMGLVLCGLMSSFMWGVSGGLMMMISHGISSSGLFCIVNIYYERLSSRSLFISKGLMIIFPILTAMMFMLCSSNISAPPTVNLLSEIYLMVSVLGYSKLMLLVFPLGSFLGAVFTLFLFSYSQHGKPYGTVMNFMGMKFSELHSLILHIIPLNFLILKPEILFMWL